MVRLKLEGELLIEHMIETKAGPDENRIFSGDYLLSNQIALERRMFVSTLSMALSM